MLSKQKGFSYLFSVKVEKKKGILQFEGMPQKRVLCSIVVIFFLGMNRSLMVVHVGIAPHRALRGGETKRRGRKPTECYPRIAQSLILCRTYQEEGGEMADDKQRQ